MHTTRLEETAVVVAMFHHVIGAATIPRGNPPFGISGAPGAPIPVLAHTPVRASILGFELMPKFALDAMRFVEKSV